MTTFTHDLPTQRRVREDDRRRAVWTFARHYGEMTAAMLVGMVALGIADHVVVDLPDRTGVQLVEMAVWMSAPMTAWMRLRGHGWRPCIEMAAAMLLPAAAALALLGAGVVTDLHTLAMVEHSAMFPAMFLVMLLRRHEYSGHHAHAAAGASS